MCTSARRPNDLPSCYYDLFVSEEIYGVYLPVDNSEERISQACKGEEGHRGGNANVDADISSSDPSPELTCVLAVSGKNARFISVSCLLVDHINGGGQS